MLASGTLRKEGINFNQIHDVLSFSLSLSLVNYRQQQWPINQHAITRPCYVTSNDVGRDKGLISSTGFQTQGKSTASNQIHAMDINMRIGPMKPSRFLEEKRWPPDDMLNGQWKVKRSTSHTNITWDSTSSQSLMHHTGTKFVGETYSTRPTEWNFGNNTKARQLLSSSDDLVRNSNSFKPQFEPPFRLEVASFFKKYFLHMLYIS